MEVYIIRHTPVDIAKDTCYGQCNVPLADTFLQDTSYFKAHLPIDFDAVFCSPLQRCTLLANELKFEPVFFEKAILEMNFGDWENTKWNDMDQAKLNIWMNDFVNVKTLNGENLVEMFDRIKLFLDQLRQQPYKKVLLITHAGVIRCIWAYMLNIPLNNIFKIPVGHNELFICNLAENPQLDAIKQIK